MNAIQRRRLVSAMDAAKDYLTSQKRFLDDAELKAMYVILNTVEASMIFNEVEALAQLCADFCHDKAKETEERN